MNIFGDGDISKSVGDDVDLQLVVCLLMCIGIDI
jgi:hypothetical protein